jgi:hypothetical protein
MPVDVEVRLVPMHPLAHPVRQPAHGKNVAGAVEGERVRIAQALTSQNFILDREETRVVGLKWVRASHPSNDTPARRRTPTPYPCRRCVREFSPGLRDEKELRSWAPTYFH